MEEDSHTDSPGAAPTKKRKTGNRGVANLTPEQLAKKRANDREAQRNIRERTRRQIETLEKRIEELTNQKPYQELQAVIRAKEEVERENAEIRQQLAVIIKTLQSIVGNPAQAPSNNHTNYMPQPQQNAHQQPPQLQRQQQQSPWPQRETYPSSTSARQSAPESDSGKGQPSHGLDLGQERLDLDFLLRNNRNNPGAGPAKAYATARNENDYRHLVGKGADPVGFHTNIYSQPSAGYHSLLAGYAYADPNTPSQRLLQGDDSSELIDTGDATSGLVPRYAAPLRTCASTCPLDSLLLDFLNERRQRAAEGHPVQEVIGPRYPSVSSLLNPAQSAYSHPLSRVFTDILAKFPDISGLPERVAVLYIMFLDMRWQVSPTKENYERLPPWMRPLKCQITTPHPAWIDHLPFPGMREKLVRLYNPEEFHFDNFFIPYTTTLRLSWPYDDTDTLLRSPDSGELMINPVFERHLRNLDNWKLGDAFARAFPVLAEHANISSTNTGYASNSTTPAAQPVN